MAFRSAPELCELDDEILGTRQEVLACLKLQAAARLMIEPPAGLRRDSDTVLSLSLECIEECIESPRLNAVGGRLPGKTPVVAAPVPRSQGKTLPPPPLPKGWKTAVTKQGEVYFWNWWTRETSYQRPMTRCGRAASPAFEPGRVGKSTAEASLKRARTYSTAITTTCPSRP